MIAHFSVCKDVNIQLLSHFESQLRGCIVIEGSLSIAIMEDEDRSLGNKSSAKLPSFPELREITDYFAIYQTSQIVRLSTMFPNLSVIRGNKLIKVSYSFNTICFSIRFFK